MISADLAGKAALVTGAASGIGLATAEALWPEERQRAAVERTPLKRACMPEDIAETIFFCAPGRR